MPNVEKDVVPSNGARAMRRKRRASRRRTWRYDIKKKATPGVASQVQKLDIATAEVGKLVKGEIAKAALKKGAHSIQFNVTVDDGLISLEHTKMSGAPIKVVVGPPAKVFDPLQAGREVVQQLQKEEGGAWTGAELNDQFRLTPATLHKRRSEHRIVSWKDARNRFHYPKWQFNDAGALISGVQDVLQTFQSLDEWRVMRYFLAPRHQLDDRTPLDLLRAGEVDKVVAHARAHAEENSW